MLRFSTENVDKPVTSQVILETGVSINILSAHINQLGGEILAEIPSAQAEKAVRAFREKGVTVDIRKLIEKDEEECTNCGACLSLCPMDAITMGDDLSVNLEAEKCIGSTCGLCVDSCPSEAIRLIG